jgi:hypothetical protein
MSYEEEDTCMSYEEEDTCLQERASEPVTPGTLDGTGEVCPSQVRGRHGAGDVLSLNSSGV